MSGTMLLPNLLYDGRSSLEDSHAVLRGSLSKQRASSAKVRTTSGALLSRTAEFEFSRSAGRGSSQSARGPGSRTVELGGFDITEMPFE